MYVAVSKSLFSLLSVLRLVCTPLCIPVLLYFTDSLARTVNNDFEQLYGEVSLGRNTVRRFTLRGKVTLIIVRLYLPATGIGPVPRGVVSQLTMSYITATLLGKAWVYTKWLTKKVPNQYCIIVFTPEKQK